MAVKFEVVLLQHPNIIQIYEVFENKDKIILVMEYASGGELYDYVSKMGCLPEAEARRIFRQITSAVLYCHKHKVAHRDLKLENILLDVSNNAKIADFGLSNYFSEKSLLSTFCGSPLYASPEIINGTPYKGPEVDCWSLGILLYTLVYGSMPFDGRDFNRMVRQIKRGAYYEPETASTASMLIRNMLRVNSDRRADIDEIASHWWLNLEENMPVIQELPENQIIDHTPLTERAEIMMVQDLVDETDVFMEFGHLSAATRRKIEEFRRRRKEAEEYNENSPIKPPKARRTSRDTGEPLLTSKEKSLREHAEETSGTESGGGKSEERENLASSSAFQDPLKRLKLLESRLQSTAIKPSAAATGEESATGGEGSKRGRTQEAVDRRPAFVSPTEQREASPTLKAAKKEEFPSSSKQAPAYWRLETDSLNVLMNQVLEQMEKGPVSMNLLARMKQHPLYEHRPMVKELLESIIAAQPSEVQREATKLIAKQQSQDLVRQKQQQSASQSNKPSLLSNADSKQIAQQPVANNEGPGNKQACKPAAPGVPSKYQVAAELPPNVAVELRKTLPKRSGALDERPWHSVEVGFSSTDSDESNTGSRVDAPESVSVAVRIEPNGKGAAVDPKLPAASKAPTERITRSEPLDDEYDEEYDEEYDDEEDEYYDAEDDGEEYESDIDELAEVVEQIGGSGSSSSKRGSTNSANSTTIQQLHAAAPKIVEATAGGGQEEPGDSDYLSTLERGLSKRQSKGKYLHPSLHHFNKIELYGRGVSTEAESPPPNKRRIGGPQPRPEHSPVLFDKAKNYLMRYPHTTEDSDQEGEKQKPASAGPKSTQKTTTHNNAESGGGESEEEEEEEEEEEGKPFRPRPSTIIGFRTIQPTGADGVRKEAPIVQVKPQAPATPTCSPATKTTGTTQQKQNKIAAPISGNVANNRGDSTAESSILLMSTSPNLLLSATDRAKSQVGSAFPFPPSSPYRLRRLYKPACRNVSIDLSPAEKEVALDPAQFPPATAEGSPQRTTEGDGSVKKWESATSYIRRKAWERRARNTTVAIGGGDELWGIRQGSPKAEGVKDAAGKTIPTRPTAPCESRIMRRRSSVTATNKSAEVNSAPLDSPHNTPPEQQQSYQARSSDAGNSDQSRRSASRQQSVAVSSDNYSRQNYIDRRKSFHDLSPERGEVGQRGVQGPPTPPHFSAELRERYGLTSGGGSRHALSTVGLYGAGGMGIGASPYQSSNVARYEDEVYNAFGSGGSGNGGQWGGGIREPNVDRFEVYRTRAERAAEANAYRQVAAGGAHRAIEHRDYDRPLSLYGGGIPGGTSTAYKSRFDDNGNFMYRRSVYEVDSTGIDPSLIAPPDPIINNHLGGGVGYHGGGGYHDEDVGGGSGILSRLKPVTRRLSSAFRSDPVGGGGESRGRMRARSQSNDRLFSVLRGEADFESAGGFGTGINGSNGGSKLTQTHADIYTPAMMASTGIGGFDFDPFMVPGGYGTAAMDPGLGGGMYGGSRLPRDLTSVDPSPLGPPMTPTRGILKNRQAYDMEARSPYYNARDTHSTGLGAGRSPFAEIGAITGTSHHLVDPLAPVLPTLPPSIGANKKRSILNLARRRTTEVRLLPSGDGQPQSSFLLDEQLTTKRPRSPIEKIKSLFRSTGFTKASGTKTALGSGYTPSSTSATTYSPSSSTATGGRSYASHMGVGGAGSYTSTYYSRYGATGNGGSGYGGYSRTTRNWHDESSG